LIAMASPSVPYFRCQPDWQLSLEEAAAGLGSAPRSFYLWHHDFAQDQLTNDDVLITKAESKDGQLSASLEAKEFEVALTSPRTLQVKHKGHKESVMIQAPQHSWNHLHSSQSVFSLAVSPQGNLCASGGVEGALRVWDAHNGQLIQDFKGFVTDVRSVKFFPSNVLLLASSHLTMKIWVVEDGSCAATFAPSKSQPAHSRTITAIDILGRGRQVLSCSLDGTAKLWDCATQSVVSSFGSFDSCGSINDCLIKQYTLETKENKGSGPSQTQSSPISADIPDSVVLLATDKAGVRGYDLRQRPGAGSLSLSLGDGVAITKLAHCSFSSSSSASSASSASSSSSSSSSSYHVAVGGDNGRVGVFDLRQTSQALCAFFKNDAAISGLSSISDSLLAVASGEGDCTLFDVSQPQARIVREFSGLDGEAVTALSTSPDGKHLFSAGSGSIRHYQLE